MIRAVLEGVIYNPQHHAGDGSGSVASTRQGHRRPRSGLWRQMTMCSTARSSSPALRELLPRRAVLGLWHGVDSLEVIAGMVGATHRHISIG
jgi:gluconokinase